ncbi:MAG: aminotransferase class I/II-fold pyridoxal phosphate-dependent enzyme [Alphaproteobacteria bacterium]|nr:MAG: aminotransferase class I/II-fold pyridoxal phosphate-dependent enzyme [Alphaproteobacteria bacterium]
MADLFDKFEGLTNLRNTLVFEKTDPYKIVMEDVISPTEAIIDGKHTILAGTNNYMGLTFDQRCIDAAQNALTMSGTGTTGSRVLNGTYAAHRELEAAIADLYCMEHAMVFSTGFLANLGMISALAGKNDIIMIDADSHASIYDGCGLSDATITRFRHNDAADLDKRLGRLNAGRRVLVIVEGLYSMLGDKAPLADIVAACKKHDAYLMVDEAHSLGPYGANGQGVAAADGVLDQVDFIVGTFSKSVGTVGGFCASNHPDFEILRLASRPYMFSASLPPSVVASATAAIKIIKEDRTPQQNLWRNAKQLHAGLTEMGFQLGADCSPVIAVLIDDRDVAVRSWEQLLDEGIYVNLALPPATPQNTNLLRCSLSAAHTPDQIDQILAAFDKVKNSNSVNQS